MIQKDITANERLYWYAMSATFNRVLKAKELLEKEGIACFSPMKYEARKVRGHKVRQLVPAISNLIFVHATNSELLRFKQKTPFLQFLTQKVDKGKVVKIIVPDRQMEQFIAVCTHNQESVIYFKPEELNLSKGMKVRIHGGPFDMMEGVFIKTKGSRNKRVVIQIEGIAVVATADINPDLLEVISE